MHWFLVFALTHPSCSMDTMPMICNGTYSDEAHVAMPSQEKCEEVRALLKDALRPKCWASADEKP
jgi:hypothetical protein